MANHILYTRANGTEIELKLDADRTVKLEERFGDSIQNKLNEAEKLSVASEFFAAALPLDMPYEKRKKIALEIYDEMTDEGKTLRDYLDVIRNILVSAGFLDAVVLERQRESTAAQEEFAKTVHEAELRRIAQSGAEISKMYTETESQSNNIKATQN